MARIKRGVAANRKRKKLLSHTKGFRWGRKNKKRLANEALLHAWSHMFRGRKQKKRDFRKLWQTKIGAAAKAEGISYSSLIGQLKKGNVSLDRKILADLAEHQPDIFKKVLQTVTSKTPAE